MTSLLLCISAFAAQILGPTTARVAYLPVHSKVLFQGDSITDMNRGRTADPNHILGHSYAFIIAAKAASTYPERQIEYINRGVSGNTVADLTARWTTDTLDLKPDILSILIGVNDLDRGVSVADYETRYDALLTQTEMVLPKTKLVLCEPFGLPTGGKKDVWAKRFQELRARQAVVARLATKHHAILVLLQGVFDDACKRAPAEQWIWDGIHPTYAGQQLIADAWVRTVNTALIDPLQDPARNSAIDPVVNFERDSYDWLHRHDDVLDQQKKENPDVVMIGDSITNFWAGLPASNRQNGPKAWAATFGNLKVLNMGFGWDRTQNVLWRLQNGEFDGLQPRSVVLNIGTNNLVGDSTARTNSPEEVAAGIESIVDALQQKSPSTHIFVMAVFPRGFEKGNPLDVAITHLNSILAIKLNGRTSVTLLDIGSKLREADGSISPAMFSDGTHPTEKGYAIWGEALKEVGALQAN